MSNFLDLSPEGKQALRDEFKRHTTTDERRVEILTLVREGADEAQVGPKCMRCGHYSFYAPWDHALIEGHVYSEDGAREVYVSSYCEFCFDLVALELEGVDDED